MAKHPMDGKEVEIQMCDRSETTERGTLVALEPLGAIVEKESRGNKVSTFIPLGKINKIVHSEPLPSK